MGDAKEPTAGEAVKATQTGKLPIGTVEAILAKAPTDCVEEVLEIPEWGCSVRVKSFTAAQNSMIKEKGFHTEGQTTTIAWAQMEKLQFQLGVVEPRFSDRDVAKLHMESGRGFQRVIDWLDEHSKIDKEELKKTQKEFQESEQSPTV